MFIKSKEKKAIEFIINVLESRGLDVCPPQIKTSGSIANISEIRWLATDKNANPKAHILLFFFNKKPKLILWMPKDSSEGENAIDAYGYGSSNQTHIILPYGAGQLSLGKINPEVFMSYQEMRDYLGY